MFPTDTTLDRDTVLITTGPTILAGILTVPPNAATVVILVNGLGDMNHQIAGPFATHLNDAGLATLSVDLMTPDEAQFDSRTGHFSSDALIQSARIRAVVDWLHENPSTHDLAIAGVAGGTAARGLLRAAADDPDAFDALIIDAFVRPADVPKDFRVPVLLFMQDDAIEMRRAQTLAETIAGPTTLRILSSIDAARAMHPIFSDAAGVIAAEWLNARL